MAACTGDSTPSGARDAAMVAILRGTGLRRSEVVALNLTDFDSPTGELQVKCGKGRKGVKVARILLANSKKSQKSNL